MKRWLWNIFCAASILVLAAATGFWAWSQTQNGRIQRSRTRLLAIDAPGRGFSTDDGIVCSGGAVCFYHVAAEQSEVIGDRSEWFFISDTGDQMLIEPGGPGDQINVHLGKFQLYRGTMLGQQSKVSQTQLVLPLWVFASAAIPPWIWWRRRRRRRGRGFPIRATAPAPQPIEVRST